MDNPILYSRVNGLQTRDSEDFLLENINMVEWNKNGDDLILDVGCGTGNVTCEILLPLVPNNIKKIYAVDINKKIIKTALKNYSHIPEVVFDSLDIGGEIDYHLRGKFDHVVSFFCLHWISDQRKVMDNIYSLLRPGGDTLFCLVCSCNQIYSTYLEMANNSRWKKYMKDAREFQLPYQYEEDPASTLRENLENSGFNVELCALEPKTYKFYDDESLIDFMESINPFVKRIPAQEQRKYMKAFVEQIKLKDPLGSRTQITRKYYTLLLAYAQKPEL